MAADTSTRSSLVEAPSAERIQRKEGDLMSKRTGNSTPSLQIGVRGLSFLDQSHPFPCIHTPAVLVPASSSSSLAILWSL